jgi:transcriptional regulator with XRE-family HTH domain
MVGMVVQETFSARLKREIAERIRQGRYPSERQFALAIGWTQEYLSRCLNNPEWRPQPETIARLATGLDLPAGEVEGWIPKPYPGEPVEGEDDPLANLQQKMALERPDVREKLRQLKIKYADRPQTYEKMERRILRAWGTNIDGIADTALDDA